MRESGRDERERTPGGGGETSSGFDSFRDTYADVLNRGLAVSGEDAAHFARRRVEWLAACLGRLGERPSSVLDYGCGQGTAGPLLRDILGAERVVGVEKSEGLLSAARELHASDRIDFVSRDGFGADGTIDLAFCNGVFHHIAPADRPDEVRFLHRALAPGGLLAFWENNPWNPGTRFIMSRIPFDRDAVTLSAVEARRLLRSGGFSILRTDHLFIFPRVFRALRPVESWLAALPVGAQYLVLCRKTT